MAAKLLLVILDGLPYANARRLMGNLEGWVETGAARVWRMRSVLPSTSASCYASLHTGVPPQAHGVLSNDTLQRVAQPDIFSQARAAGLRTAAVAHSFWSCFFRRAPFDPVRDLEIDDEASPIQHGRFYTMSGYGPHNFMTPSDADLLAQLTGLIERHGVDYGLLHTCTVDSMGHMWGTDSLQMDRTLFVLDGQLAPYLARWRARGYEVIVTSDHGQTGRGHHGGAAEEMRDVALYYFGTAKGPPAERTLDQLQLAPTALARLGADIPDTMRAEPFLE